MENYEERFFRTFEDALPPPARFRRTAISMNKPALPLVEDDLTKSCGDDSADMRNDGKIRRYRGPCAFVLPGNHDWFDGLATYTRLILSRHWLGGWLMPQERSYFALHLSHGWWLLGFDLSISTDIDDEQFKFSANVAMRNIGPTDAVIIVTHEPHWVTDYDAKKAPQKLGEANLRELMDTYLVTTNLQTSANFVHLVNTDFLHRLAPDPAYRDIINPFFRDSLTKFNIRPSYFVPLWLSCRQCRN
ncbi:MAG: hypothetical protein ACRDL7_12610 [Gaiellaceae bacterium]